MNNLGAKSWQSIFNLLVYLKLSFFASLKSQLLGSGHSHPVLSVTVLQNSPRLLIAEHPILVGRFFPLMINFALKPDTDLESNFFLWNCHHMTQRSRATAGRVFQTGNRIGKLPELSCIPLNEFTDCSCRQMGDDVSGICFLYHLHLIIKVVVIKCGSFYFGRR